MNGFFTDEFRSNLRKIQKKDRSLHFRVVKKVVQILENPYHYKPLRNVLKNYRAVHVDPFVILFDIKGSEVVFHYIKHHDKAYKYHKT